MDLAVETLALAREALATELNVAIAATDHDRSPDLARRFRKTAEALARVTGIISDPRRTIIHAGRLGQSPKRANRDSQGPNDPMR